MHSEITEWLRSLKEKDIYPIIRDLLISMGYEKVTIMHGQLEFGRDICFMEVDKIGRQIWRGIQVKIGSLTGSLTSSKGVRYLINQCEAAMDTPFITPDGQEVHLNEIWILLTNSISEQAKQSIKGKLSNNRSIQIIDEPSLCDLIEKHLPHLIESGSLPMKNYLKYFITFSDSPEQYLAVRLNAKWLISDVFINPRLVIEIIHPKYLPQKHILNSFELFFQQQEYYLTLIKNRLLPHTELFFIAEKFSDLISLYQLISDFEWYDGELQFFEKSLSSLLSTISDTEINIDEPFSMTRFIRTLEPKLNQDDLKLIEIELSGINIEQNREVREYSKWLRKAKQPDTLKSPEERLATDMEGREQFFANLLYAYKNLTDRSNPIVSIVLQCSSIYYKRLAQPQNTVLQQNINIIRNILTEFDKEFKKYFCRLWDEGNLAELKSCDLDPKELNELKIMGELNQLTKFISKFCGLNEKENIKYSCGGLELCEHLPRVVITGEFGIGKTTLLKRYGNIQAKRAVDNLNQTIPVFSPLSTLTSESGKPIEELLLSSSRGIKLNSSILGSEKIQWILDGLDEMPSSHLRDEIINWSFLKEGLGKRVVLSSRPHVLPVMIPGCTIATLQTLDQGQIESLIQKFQWDNEIIKEKIINSLRNSNELLNMAKNPLLLMLILIMASRSDPDKLPRRREQIYKCIVNLLLGEWDSAKAVLRSKIIEDENYLLRILLRVAYLLYIEGYRSFKKDTFIDLSMDAIPKKRLDFDSAMEFFDYLLQTCMIVPLSQNNYGFFHFSIHEYLTAEDLAIDNNESRIYKVIEKYFKQKGWGGEVLFFYAGIKRDVSSLINNLHLHFSQGGSIKSDNIELINLISKWFDVADFMDVDRLIPQRATKDVIKSLQEHRISHH